MFIVQATVEVSVPQNIDKIKIGKVCKLTAIYLFYVYGLNNLHLTTPLVTLLTYIFYLNISLKDLPQVLSNWKYLP